MNGNGTPFSVARTDQTRFLPSTRGSKKFTPPSSRSPQFLHHAALTPLHQELAMKKTLIIAAVAFSAGFATQAFAEKQPMMHKALAQLEDAKKALEAATADKGGHRVKAIEHVNAAIAETRAGIEFDNKN
jgi:hypothetical protein